MPVSSPPAFKPAVPPIPLGTSGYVLTSNGPSSAPSFQAAGGGGGSGVGSFLAYASAAGTSNNVAPSGFSSSVGRLWVTLASGSAVWTGLEAGNDAQILILTNADTIANLTLDVQNSGSSSANQFYGPDTSRVLTPGNSCFLCYYSNSTLTGWVFI